MQTRSSTNWHHKPGKFDTLHTKACFPSNNTFGIPSIAHAPLSFTPDWIAPYRTRIRSQQGMTGGAVHFFLDDYRFETTWSRPAKALQYLRGFRTLLTPDFSIYPEWPLALQIWNTYRSRWCGAYWSSLGFQVIPTVSWAGRASFDFCFAGIQRHSLVALSTVGVRKTEWISFLVGFQAMVEQIEPSLVLCYGKAHPDMEKIVAVRCYPTRWEGIKQARNHGW